MNEKETRPHEGEARVLTRDERENFQGVTIDEGGQEEASSQHHRSNEQTGFEGTQFKVYTVSDMSLMKKVLFGLAIIGGLIALFIFGGFLVVVFAIIAIIGALISMLSGWF